MTRLESLHNAICETIFTTKPRLGKSRLPHAFQLLVKLIEREENTNWEYGSHCTLSDLIVGAYWWYSDNYAGQWSEEYATLCALGRIFSPGKSTLGPDSSEVYNSLSSLFGVSNVE